MPFGKMGIRAWSREWRTSDWRETIPLASGRECPRDGCKATVCGGKSWRDHWAGHQQADELAEEVDRAIRALSDAVRVMARALAREGMITLTDDGGEAPEEAEGEPVLRGMVIGNGPLPAETRGGGE